MNRTVSQLAAFTAARFREVRQSSARHSGSLPARRDFFFVAK
jgi:hypothetical protein